MLCNSYKKKHKVNVELFIVSMTTKTKSGLKLLDDSMNFSFSKQVCYFYDFVLMHIEMQRLFLSTVSKTFIGFEKSLNIISVSLIIKLQLCKFNTYTLLYNFCAINEIKALSMFISNVNSDIIVFVTT